jgi:hypothetical protein
VRLRFVVWPVDLIAVLHRTFRDSGKFSLGWLLLACSLAFPWPAYTQDTPNPGDVRIIGDFDGDGFIDSAVWQVGSGTWLVIPSSNPSATLQQQWGLQGDIPVAADYDGDGHTDYAVWRPSNGTWYIIPSSNPAAVIQQQ